MLRRLTRRKTLGGLLACAGAAAFVHTSRAKDIKAPVGDAAPLTELGMELSAEQRAAGVALLRHHASVDTHSHPGRFFLKKLIDQTPTTRAFGEPFEDQAIADLTAGNVSAALFCAVADMRLLEMTPTQGLRAARDWVPGEAYADYRRQITELKTLLSNPALTPGLTPADIGAAHRRHKTGAVFAVEGGDFIEQRLDRVHEAFRDGVRAVTLVHYHVNQIGDIQTEAPVHDGLTALGKSIVAEMNRAGIIIDLAHATFAVTKDVLGVSSKPIMVSHTNIATASANHPRLISVEHAKLVAAAGGIIGSWPSGMGQTSFSDYIDSIQRLVDTVGIDHAAIGTDMDANFKPVLRSYRDWSLIPAALLARGMHDEDVAKIMGGNFLRVFKSNLNIHRKR
ncbi:MAG TPA: membrane dipeptidase [Steroidobacteraceae bacterium]|nr:membrane dipeptidase [Steroidobacteraceae bacterium]